MSWHALLLTFMYLSSPVPSAGKALDWLWPNHNYLGPGNKMDNGPPTNYADCIAAEHDSAYDVATTPEEIRQADLKALKEFWSHSWTNGSLSSAIGALGVSAKYLLESLTGDIPGVQNVSLEKKEPCEKSLLNSWEQRHSCILPYDLKNFYLSTDGFLMTWSFSNGGEEIPIGNLHINSLAKLRRLAGVNSCLGDSESTPCLLDLDPFVPKSQKERPLFKSSCKIFELDTCRDVASVCLVYVEHKINPSIWLMDRSLDWHFLSPSFTQYFRMMLVYQGLPEWQYNLTPIGLAPWAEQLMYTFTPHLHSPPPVRKDICSSEVQLDPSIFKLKSKHSKKTRSSDNHEDPREGKSTKASSSFRSESGGKYGKTGGH